MSVYRCINFIDRCLSVYHEKNSPEISKSLVFFSVKDFKKSKSLEQLFHLELELISFFIELKKLLQELADNLEFDKVNSIFMRVQRCLIFFSSRRGIL
jgi:hypothetical protein